MKFNINNNLEAGLIVGLLLVARSIWGWRWFTLYRRLGTLYIERGGRKIMLRAVVEILDPTCNKFRTLLPRDRQVSVQNGTIRYCEVLKARGSRWLTVWNSNIHKGDFFFLTGSLVQRVGGYPTMDVLAANLLNQSLEAEPIAA
jgi:hypothetical protein